MDARLTTVENQINNRPTSEKEHELERRVNELEIKLANAAATSAIKPSQPTDESLAGINMLARDLEAQDKFNRKKNIIIKGLDPKSNDIRKEVDMFLSKEFNLNGVVSDAKTIGLRKQIVYATLTDFEAQLEILKDKRRVLTNKKIYVDSELTRAERSI